MRIHSIQDNLQKSDIVSRLQQSMQEPVRAQADLEAEGGRQRAQDLQEQTQQVPQTENLIVEDGRRGSPFGRRRRNKPNKDEPETEDQPQAPGHDGRIDLTA